MRCIVCNHEEAKSWNRILLSPQGRRTGVVSELARRLKCSRQVIWRHRKFHLHLEVGNPQILMQTVGKERTIEERVKILGAEAHRLQLLSEQGVDITRALEALKMRRALLELEAKIAGKLDQGSGGAKVLVQNLVQAPREEAVTAEEADRVVKEYLEVCGRQALPGEVGASDEPD